MTIYNDKRQLPYGGAFSIQDPNTVKLIKSATLADCLWQEDISAIFLQRYKEWILKTKNNIIKGLDLFPYYVYSNGTSQAFDMFYMKNREKRFRCFRGEYVYHQLAWRNNWPAWKFIEDEDLSLNDAVVISLPFSDTGNQHDKMHWLLAKCNELKIPVLVDCAYFGICSDIEFDFRYDCITDVTFSLSKTFPVAHARIGIRFTKVDDDDLMFVYNKINYNNRISAGLAIQLFETFGPDYIYDKYNFQQRVLCERLFVIPSNTVIFGIDTNNRYPEYNRGSDTNRLGLYKYYEV